MPVSLKFPSASTFLEEVCDLLPPKSAEGGAFRNQNVESRIPIGHRVGLTEIDQIRFTHPSQNQPQSCSHMFPIFTLPHLESRDPPRKQQPPMFTQPQIPPSSPVPSQALLSSPGDGRKTAASQTPSPPNTQPPSVTEEKKEGNAENPGGATPGGTTITYVKTIIKTSGEALIPGGCEAQSRLTLFCNLYL